MFDGRPDGISDSDKDGISDGASDGTSDGTNDGVVDDSSDWISVGEVVVAGTNGVNVQTRWRFS